MILAFDTSSALSSVAVVDGESVVAARRHLDARRHAELLAPLFADLDPELDRGSVTAIACGVGPGPYTGLRVGIATALAVGTAWQRPVLGLCSLDAIAAAVVQAQPGVPGFSVAVDARRREVYWARYGAGGARIEGPRVSRPADIDPGLRAGLWVGHGAALHADLFGEVVNADDAADPRSYPHAEWIGRRVGALLDAGAPTGRAPIPLDAHGEDTGATARALSGHELLPPRPLYLRRPDAVATEGVA